MKDLYYAPKIEEFHINFRYESYEFSENTFEMEWRERAFPQEGLLATDNDGDPDLVELFYSNLKTETRVKYLDQSDIEELGWIETPLPLTDRKSYYKPGFRLVVSEKGVHIFKTKENGEGDFTLFFGQIKNWNEMKTLMTQLNIL